jgi:ABC-type sugar transport system substrate-binding protein
VVAILAGSQPMNAVFERVLKAGVPVVLLNRIPDWFQSVRSNVPAVMLAGVAPDQLEIGRIQALQALRLTAAAGGPAPGVSVRRPEDDPPAVPGAARSFAMLVTGTGTSAAAVQRRRGFLEALGGRLEVQETDGGWSAQGAQRALAAWFRVGADRDRIPQIVVCQNDAMAAGARSALQFQAATANMPDLARVPLTGCDGLEQEGRASVKRGELAATVILPATTPAALQLLKAYFESGARPGDVIRLPVTSLPELESLRPV